MLFDSGKIVNIWLFAYKDFIGKPKGLHIDDIGGVLGITDFGFGRGGLRHPSLWVNFHGQIVESVEPILGVYSS